jgi:hypothetical protein
MTAQATITSFSLFPKPPPFEIGQPFQAHFNKTTIYAQQHIPESEHFFALGQALFLRNVSQNHTYATMPSSMRQLPDKDVTKRLQKIADILKELCIRHFKCLLNTRTLINLLRISTL